MGTYATTSDVAALLPGRTIDGTSDPTLTEVGAWVDQAEDRIEGEVEYAGITSDGVVTNARGVSYLKEVVSKGVAATFLEAKSAGSELNEEDRRLAEQYRAYWNEFLVIIDEEPKKAATLLGHGQSSGDRGVFRSHVQDNTTSKSVSNGDFDAKFGKDDEP